MDGKAEKLEAVAPLINDQIKGYKTNLNIVERPAVGTLAVPERVCTLLYQFLGFSLYTFTKRRTTKVRVSCRRATTTRLVLEIVADSAWPPADELRASEMFGELNKEAVHIGGEAVHGGEMHGKGQPAHNVFFRLTVPIPA